MASPYFQNFDIRGALDQATAADAEWTRFNTARNQLTSNPEWMHDWVDPALNNPGQAVTNLSPYATNGELQLPTGKGSNPFLIGNKADNKQYYFSRGQVAHEGERPNWYVNLVQDGGGPKDQFQDVYDPDGNFLRTEGYKRAASPLLGIAAILSLPFVAAGLQGAFAGGMGGAGGAGAGAGGLGGAESFLPMHEMTHSAGFLSELGLGGIKGGLAAGSFMNSLPGRIASKLGTNAITGALGGGGGQQGGGGGMFDNMSLLDILGIGGAGLAGYKQYDAASHMLDWLNGQQAKVDNLYAPGSPEATSLWDQMSRKDAAAGRNSQYGPRSVDLAARIAEIKARNTAQMTTGIGGAYASALNGQANAFAGIPALANYMGQRGGGSGGGRQLINGISGLFGSKTGVGTDVIPQGVPFSSSPSNMDIENMINGGDFGGGGFDFGGFDDLGSFF